MKGYTRIRGYKPNERDVLADEMLPSANALAIHSVQSMKGIKRSSLSGKETEPRNIPLTEYRCQGWQKLDMSMLSERRYLFSDTMDISLIARLTMPRFFLGNGTADKLDF